ncbi:MAG TPA: cytochrome c peroxidase [Candidatus Angelobacter sp.]|jgi:cytochrome c peroxidase|nr:cytochrome c peroxidase [Candidatus Angelobacter sp.]
MKHSDIPSRLTKAFLTALLIALPVYGQRYDSPSSYTKVSPAPSAANALDAVKVALGKRLFSDSRLSFDEWNSCASCHEPSHGFSESRPVSVGVLNHRGKRHTPTLLGRGSGVSQFWDGRAATLEEQVLMPISDPNEMGTTVEAALQRLHQDPVYRRLTRESLAEALASYVRSIRSENSNYDLFLWGWPGAISDLELEGLRLFQNKARCYLCHSSNRFTDEQFHNTGIAWRDGALQDEGRAAITGKPYHKGAFKTPTLRDVGRRGPYMHDGSLATLEDVIEYYNRGGNHNPYLDENIVPLNLSDAEKKALLAFLRSGLAGKIQDGVIEKPLQSRNRPINLP